MNGQQQAMPAIEDLPPEDLHRLIKRDRFIKEVLVNRSAQLALENCELLAVVQELQGQLIQLQQDAQTVARADQFPSNGPQPAQR